MLDPCKMVQKQPLAFFSSLKQKFIAYSSSKVSSRSDCIFEIHQLWKPGFSRVYSKCCSCSFEPEIIKIGLSSHKMCSNNILNVQGTKTISNACIQKKSGNLLNSPRICFFLFCFVFFFFSRWLLMLSWLGSSVPSIVSLFIISIPYFSILSSIPISLLYIFFKIWMSLYCSLSFLPNILTPFSYINCFIFSCDLINV